MNTNTADWLDFYQSIWRDRITDWSRQTNQTSLVRDPVLQKKEPETFTSSLLSGAIDESWGFKEIDAIIDRIGVIEDLKRIIRKRLGYRAVSRLKKLASYRADWGYKGSMAMSSHSAELLSGFLQEFGEFDTKPSLFLTDQGHLELAWEDKSGQAISIVFHEGGYHVERGTISVDFPITNPQHIQNIARSLSEVQN